MRKSYIFLSLIVILGVVCYLAPFLFEGSFLDPNTGTTSWALVSLVFLALTLGAVFFEFENRATSAKQIALIAMLGTVSALSRIPFAALMNFQPCTFFIICSGYVFGPMSGFMVGAVTPIISNIFLGQGPWTAYQIFTWGLTGLLAGVIGRYVVPQPDLRKTVLMAYGILAGILYAMIINIWFWAMYLYPHTLATYKGALYTAALWTVSHSAANVFFLWLFGNRVIGLLERFKRRFFWSSEMSYTSQTKVTSPVTIVENKNI
jgi:energy-coupling factor transport system substrate-specific component